jgi:hypothetical protein
MRLIPVVVDESKPTVVDETRFAAFVFLVRTIVVGITIAAMTKIPKLINSKRFFPKIVRLKIIYFLCYISK